MDSPGEGSPETFRIASLRIRISEDAQRPVGRAVGVESDLLLLGDQS